MQSSRLVILVNQKTNRFHTGIVRVLHKVPVAILANYLHAIKRIGSQGGLHFTQLINISLDQSLPLHTSAGYGSPNSLPVLTSA